MLGLNFDVDKDWNLYFPQTFSLVNCPWEGWGERLLPASLIPSRPELWGLLPLGVLCPDAVVS